MRHGCDTRRLTCSTRMLERGRAPIGEAALDAVPDERAVEMLGDGLQQHVHLRDHRGRDLVDGIGSAAARRRRQQSAMPSKNKP